MTDEYEEKFVISQAIDWRLAILKKWCLINEGHLVKTLDKIFIVSSHPLRIENIPPTNVMSETIPEINFIIG